jgi:hypothetical protein
MQKSELKRGQLISVGLLGLGLAGVAFANPLAHWIEVPVDKLHGFSAGLIGGCLMNLLFTLRPMANRPERDWVERTSEQSKWFLLASLIGLGMVFAGLLALEIWPDATWVWWLFVGLIPACLAVFPLTNMRRAAMVDPSLHDERQQLVELGSSKAGFDTMFTLCMIGGAAVYVFDWQVSAGAAFYMIGIAGAFRQMLFLTRVEWRDRA